MMTRIQRLFELAHIFYKNSDPAHDLGHIRRVMQTCERLSRSEGANAEITLAGAILHDIVNLPKNHPQRSSASQLAAEQSISFLRQAGFDENEIAHIQQVIIEHSFSLGRKPHSLESAILQDADRLDALGAIGVMRVISCGASMGSRFYDDKDPFANTRALDDKAFTLDHFEVKLFKLPELMNTRSAKIEAEKRVAYMRSFLAQLSDEIGTVSPSPLP